MTAVLKAEYMLLAGMGVASMPHALVEHRAGFAIFINDLEERTKMPLM